MNLNLLAETDSSSSIVMFAVLGVFFVIMILMTVIPQRKQKKKMAEMMSSLAIGDSIMTIGGFVGVITDIDAEADRYSINIGTEEEPVITKIIKNAIRTKL